MGTEPVDSEIPLELHDFPIDIQASYMVYGYLQDVWEGMSGTYMGKSMNGIIDIMGLLEIPIDDQKIYLDYIRLIDDARSQQISESKPKTKKASSE